jgi:hypothetical protein
VALPRAPKPKPSERGPCPTTVARPPPTAVGVDGVRDIAREQGEGARREEGADPSQEVERGQRRRGVEPHPFEAGERPPGPGHPAERAQDNKTGEGRARDPDPSEPRDRAAHRRVGRRHSWPSIRAHRSLLDCPTRPRTTFRNGLRTPRRIAPISPPSPTSKRAAGRSRAGSTGRSRPPGYSDPAACRRARRASSRGTPTNSSRPSIAIAGVATTRYFRARPGCSVTSNSSSCSPEHSARASSITRATRALAA